MSETDPGKAVAARTLQIGDIPIIRPPRESPDSRTPPAQAFETRMAIAAFVCGYDLISEKGLVYSVDAEADTPEAMAASMVVKWIWNGKKNGTFRWVETGPDGKLIAREETIGINEFAARFGDLDWCGAHLDHPISYLRHFLEKSRKYLPIVAGVRPALRHVRDGAEAVLPADYTPEQVDAVFSELEG